MPVPTISPSPCSAWPSPIWTSAPGAATGKVVFLNVPTERAKDGRGYGAAVIARFRGARLSAKAGAVGRGRLLGLRCVTPSLCRHR